MEQPRNSFQACVRKARHRNRRAAMVEVRAAQARGHFLSAYRCEHCGHWHVGHSWGWVQKREFLNYGAWA